MNTPASETLIARYGQALQDAHSSREPIAPLSTTHPELSIHDAYLIQRHLVGSWITSGHSIVGRKIGLTSKKMQDMLGVAQPDFGVVRDDQLFYSGAVLKYEHYIQPRIEPEVAFYFSRDLAGEDCQPIDVLKATEWVAPALEVIDSRIENWKIGIVDTIADNASGASVVVGEARPVRGIDLRGMGCVLELDGKVDKTGAGGAVLGSPLVAISWLVRTLAEFGEGISAGEFVIPGSITAAVPISAGQHVKARFSQIGSVQASFSPKEA